MFSIILHSFWAFSDIAIPLFAYNVIANKTLRLNKYISMVLFIAIFLIYSFFNVNYLYIQIPLFIIFVLLDNRKTSEKQEYFYYIGHFIILNIIILPILNITYFYMFHGFMDFSFSLYDFFSQPKLDFLVKMTVLLVLFYERNETLDLEGIEKTFMKCSYFFIFICYIFFIVLIVISLSLDNQKLLVLISGLSSMVVVLFLIFNILFQWLYDKLQENNTLLIAQEKTKIELESLLENQRFIDEMRKFKHDIKNNFTVINHMIQVKEFQAASNYLQSYLDSFENIGFSVDTDNLVVSAILNNKIRKHQTLEFDVRCFIPKEMRIENLDINTILGNLVDNACEYMERENLDGKITIKITSFADNNLFIEISNPCNETLIEGNTLKTKKEDKESHGYGILNVENTVNKYHGVYLNKIENGQFISQILIPEGVRKDDYIKTN